MLPIRSSYRTFCALLWALIALCPLGTVRADAASAGSAAAGLDQSFQSPPDAAKPWAYWWWLNANVSQQSITRDLEEMKKKGLGGFLLFDVVAYGQQHVPSPPRRAEFLSLPWLQLVKHAMSEASRLGLEMSMNLSTCGGALRAPWSTGDDAPKSLFWTAVEVAGPRHVTCVLPRPTAPHVWEASLLAVRIDDQAAPAARPAGQAPAAAGGDEIRFLNDPKHWQPVVVKPQQPSTAAEVVNLSDRIDAAGRVAWDVPAGHWRLLRFLYTVMEGKESESDVDMLDANAVQRHFNRFGKPILEDAGPLVGKTFTHFYSVSWEGAVPTWTFGFDRQFEQYRGYAAWPYLPVLAGMTVKNAEISQRFLRDYSRTISDCFMINCYETLGKLCRAAGVKWHSESGGPWRRETLLLSEADSLAFWGRNDMPQGEFWWPGTAIVGRGNARLVAMAAHTYGRPLVSIEAFTHMQPHWSAYPAALKPGADAAFCDGINKFVWHTFSASPPEFGKPGIVYFAGTHLNPNVTWFQQAAEPLLDYLGRCQMLLRQGRFVADVCTYRSDKNYATWSRDPRASKLPPRPPKGYACDWLSTEVLLQRLAVKDGKLVLPDGMQYRVLLLDPEDDVLPAATLQKTIQLAREGATVVLGPRQPQFAPGLRNYPACDEEVRRLAAELWADAAAGPFRRAIGKGKIIGGSNIDEALAAEGILPDCAGPVEYIHRQAENLDLYFVSGTGEVECTFRAGGREPELWDPKTGAIRDAVCYRATDGGRTIVPLSLPENGSMFVVFRKPTGQPHVIRVAGPQPGMEIEGRGDAGVRLCLWQKGHYVFDTSQGKQLAVDAAIADPMILSGPWEVRFAPGWGAPESIVFPELTAWDKHQNTAIKHFSGTATYRKTLRLSSQQVRRPLRLQLGDVRYVASVRLNGKHLGVVWTSPWMVDLSAAAQPGENTLEIDVTNLWPNRLIGDAGLPENQRLTKTNIRLEAVRTVKPYEGYGANDPLLPSGLLGPVRIEFGQREEVRF
jgi:hypothetical protein